VEGLFHEWKTGRTTRRGRLVVKAKREEGKITEAGGIRMKVGHKKISERVIGRRKKGEK